MTELHTERLILRGWRESDWAAFAAMNADPAVMEHFPAVLTTDESNALADRIQAHIDEHGWGLWAAEVTGGEPVPFIGFIGLARPRFEAHFTPAVEIGWRLAKAAWHKGYATEGARRVLAFAYEDLGLDEVVSFTTAGNSPSRAVMERLGMHRDPADDFEHPAVPKDNPARHHVLYRLGRQEWAAARAAP